MSDWHYVVDLSAGSGPAFLVAVFTERVELAVSCRQLVPSMIIMTPSTTLALIAFTSAVVVSLRAYLLHVFISCVSKAPPLGTLLGTVATHASALPRGCYLAARKSLHSGLGLDRLNQHAV